MVILEIRTLEQPVRVSLGFDISRLIYSIPRSINRPSWTATLSRWTKYEWMGAISIRFFSDDKYNLMLNLPYLYSQLIVCNYLVKVLWPARFRGVTRGCTCPEEVILFRQNTASLCILRCPVERRIEEITEQLHWSGKLFRWRIIICSPEFWEGLTIYLSASVSIYLSASVSCQQVFIACLVMWIYSDNVVNAYKGTRPFYKTVNIYIIKFNQVPSIKWWIGIYCSSVHSIQLMCSSVYLIGTKIVWRYFSYVSIHNYICTERICCFRDFRIVHNLKYWSTKIIHRNLMNKHQSDQNRYCDYCHQLSNI